MQYQQAANKRRSVTPREFGDTSQAVGKDGATGASQAQSPWTQTFRPEPTPQECGGLEGLDAIVFSRSLSLEHNPTEGALGQPGEGGGRRERWRAGVGESSSSSYHDLGQLYLEERMQTAQPPPSPAVLVPCHGSIEFPRPQTRNRLRCPQRGGERIPALPLKWKCLSQENS